MNTRTKSIEISVPASVANLGPALDTLAVAVQLYLRVRVCDIDPRQKNKLDFDFVDQSLDGENGIERAFCFMVSRNGVDFPSLRIAVTSEIPTKAGLGSSAAAVIAGLRLYESVMGPCTTEEMLTAACVLEGHPNNAAAALLGGRTSSCQLPDGSVLALASPWPVCIGFAVLTPDLPLNTAVSRQALPASIFRADAVFNLQRVALLFQALQSGKYHLLKEGLRDRCHQPFRQCLVPGLEQALALDHPDLLGVCLSGSGPSIVALAQNNLRTVGQLLADCYSPLKIPYRVRILRAHQPETRTSAGNERAVSPQALASM